MSQTDVDRQKLTELIEEAIDRGSRSVEDIHRTIADLPLEVLANLGLFEGAAQEVKRIQDQSIGLVYDRIRHINHEVRKLATDLLAPLEDPSQG